LQANKAHPDELSKKLKKVSKKVIPDAPWGYVMDGGSTDKRLEQAWQFTVATEVTALALQNLMVQQKWSCNCKLQINS
jgi:hypothetical protein